MPVIMPGEHRPARARCPKPTQRCPPLPMATNMLRFSQGLVRRTFAGLVTVVVLHGCSPSADGVATTQTETEKNLPQLQAAAGKLTVRIVPEGQGPPRYYFGNATNPSRLAAL